MPERDHSLDLDLSLGAAVDSGDITQDDAAARGARMVVKGREIPWSTLPQLVAALAAEHGDRHVLEIDGKTLTYARIDASSTALAAGMAALGLRKGNVAAGLMANCIESVLCFFACAKLGAIWAPLNVGLVGQDLAYAVGDAAPRLMVVDAENAAKLQAEPLASRIAFPVFVAGADPHPAFEPLAALEEAGPLPTVELGPGDPAVVIYTGGTTGMPKGVVLPHFAVICGGLRTIETFSMRPEDNYFSISQLFHVGGLFGAVMGPMIAGARGTIEKRFSLSNYWRRVRDTKATLIDLIGTTMALLCREPPSPLDRAHSIRASLGITAGVPPQIPREFTARFGIGLINLYSLSEGGGTMIVRNTPDSPKPDAHGKGWGWVEIAIQDATGQALPPHAMGEIVLRPQYPFIFMLGYLNNPQKTIETFANCWLHTGDLGFLDEDGYLYFRGRHAHWLRRRGENISAHEVESILSQYPGIAEIVVIGVPSDMGDEDVKALIIPEAGAVVDFAALSYWAAEQMAAFKVPRYFQIVADFPRSLTKREIERHKLKALPGGPVWDREAVLGRSLARREAPPQMPACEGAGR